MEKQWIKLTEEIPPLDTAVETKIDDINGVRNQQPLLLHNRLWWFTDMSVYVYYATTHWRHL